MTTETSAQKFYDPFEAIELCERSFSVSVLFVGVDGNWATFSTSNRGDTREFWYQLKVAGFDGMRDVQRKRASKLPNGHLLLEFNSSNGISTDRFNEAELEQLHDVIHSLFAELFDGNNVGPGRVKESFLVDAGVSLSFFRELDRVLDSEHSESGILVSPSLVSYDLRDPKKEDSKMPNENVTAAALYTLNKQLIDLLQHTLIPSIDRIVTRTDALLDRVVAPKESKPKPDLSLLSEKQRKAFDRIAAIKGNGPASMKKAEVILASLKPRESDAQPEKITESFARLLILTMRQRGWGVRCSCGSPASYVWQANSKCAHGGVLSVSHYTDGKQRFCDPSTTYLGHPLIEKVDRRRKAN